MTEELESAESSSTQEVLPPSAEDAAAADELKGQANSQFKECNFYEAIELYTKAIDINPASAVYYCNRAAAHIKIDQHGSAMADAAQAIKLDPKYIKAYYRRGDAKLALGKFTAALKDFKLAAQGAPRDPDLKRKLAECAKESQRQRFEKALRSDTVDEIAVSDSLNLDDILVDESYTGPRMDLSPASSPRSSQELPEATSGEGTVAEAAPQAQEGTQTYEITHEFVTAMMDAFREQRTVHRRFVLDVMLRFQKLVKALPSLVDIEVPQDSKITVCGDTHGQFYDLLNIFEINGLPSRENPYLFNGDFVDRGSWSVEVIVTLMAWKVLDPACMHLTRGNHEAQSLNKLYGFEGEVKHKYNGTVMDVFKETFCWLPLAYCLSSKVLVLHGGLFSRDGVTLDDIRKEDRCREPPDSGIMCECLWSDPQPMPGRAPSKRGCGVQFGPDITKKFLEDNGLSLLVRSHEVKDGGYEVAHDGYCVTVFSAPNYCDNMANKGAFITFNGSDMVPHFTQFEAVPHPDIKPMAYSSSIFSFL